MSQEKNKDNLFKEGQHVIHRINKNEYIFYKKEIIIKANKNGDHFYLEHDRNLCLVYPVRSQFEWVHERSGMKYIIASGTYGEAGVDISKSTNS